MAIILELAPEVEATLAAQAQAHGLPLEAYIANMLRQVAGGEGQEHAISLEQFEAELDALAAHTAKIPILPLEALTREAIYRDHD